MQFRSPFFLALYFAWTETLARYRRSYLGPFWMVIGTALSIVCLSFVWADLIGVSREEFVPNISIGIVLWQLISAVIQESPGNFSRNQQTLLNYPLDPFSITLQLMDRAIINFLHSLVIIVPLFIFFPSPNVSSIFVALASLILVLGNLLFISYILSVIGLRFRDVESLVNGLIPLIFFFTPVLYNNNKIKQFSFLIMAHPFTHFIQIVREPLVNNRIELGSTLYLLVFLGLNFSIFLYVRRISNQHLRYWL